MKRTAGTPRSSNGIIKHNRGMWVRNEGKDTNNQTFYLDEAASAVDENPETCRATRTGSDNRLADKHSSANQEILQWLNTPKGKLEKNTERMQFVITCRE